MSLTKKLMFGVDPEAVLEADQTVEEAVESIRVCDNLFESYVDEHDSSRTRVVTKTTTTGTAIIVDYFGPMAERERICAALKHRKRPEPKKPSSLPQAAFALDERLMSHISL